MWTFFLVFIIPMAIVCVMQSALETFWPHPKEAEDSEAERPAAKTAALDTLADEQTEAIRREEERKEERKVVSRPLSQDEPEEAFALPADFNFAEYRSARD